MIQCALVVALEVERDEAGQGKIHCRTAHPSVADVEMQHDSVESNRGSRPGEQAHDGQVPPGQPPPPPPCPIITVISPLTILLGGGSGNSACGSVTMSPKQAA